MKILPGCWDLCNAGILPSGEQQFQDMRTDYTTANKSGRQKQGKEFVSLVLWAGVQLQIVDNKLTLLSRHMPTNVTRCWQKDKFMHVHQIHEVKSMK
jgi:hypothetical protein